jgi:hypothetical protein
MIRRIFRPRSVGPIRTIVPGHFAHQVLISFPNRPDELEFYALRQVEPGGAWTSFDLSPSPYAIKGQAAVNILRAWQAAPPKLTALPMMQMQLGESTVMFLP